jgi:hypothetical protein
MIYTAVKMVFGSPRRFLPSPVVQRGYSDLTLLKAGNTPKHTRPVTKTEKTAVNVSQTVPNTSGQDQSGVG